MDRLENDNGTSEAVLPFKSGLGFQDSGISELVESGTRIGTGMRVRDGVQSAGKARG